MASNLAALLTLSALPGESFISPLYGHTTTFVVDGRRTNLALARAMLCHLTRKGHQCAVLDVDASYSSNSDYVLGPLSERQAKAVEITVPDPDSDLESSVAGLIASGAGRVIMIDSLNSLYHLLVAGGRGFKGRKLAFVMACLSYRARTEGGAVLATMYKRESAVRFGGGQQISNLSDHTAFVDFRDDALLLRYDWGRTRLGEAFCVPIP